MKIKLNLKLTNGLPPMKRLFIVFNSTFWRLCASMEVNEYFLGNKYQHLPCSSRTRYQQSFFLSSGSVFLMSLDNGTIHFQISSMNLLNHPILLLRGK